MVDPCRQGKMMAAVEPVMSPQHVPGALCLGAIARLHGLYTCIYAWTVATRYDSCGVEGQWQTHLRA